VTPEDAEAFTLSLGHVFSGGYGLIVHAKEQGVPEALGLTLPEWVNDKLGGYVRLSITERREAAAELADRGMSQREIADVLGVSHDTVNRDLKPDAFASPEPEEAQVSEPEDAERDAFASPEAEPEPEPEVEETEEPEATAHRSRRSRSRSLLLITTGRLLFACRSLIPARE
jgi:hypothetical protein